jgi:hypothetical protein
VLPTGSRAHSVDLTFGSLSAPRDMSLRHEEGTASAVDGGSRIETSDQDDRERVGCKNDTSDTSTIEAYGANRSSSRQEALYRL